MFLRDLTIRREITVAIIALVLDLHDCLNLQVQDNKLELAPSCQSGATHGLYTTRHQ